MQRIQNKKSTFNYLLLLMGGIAVVLGGITFLPCCRNHVIHFLDRTVVPYDDRVEKTLPGNSETLLIDRDSTELKLRYVLKPGFTYPYAGILIFLKDSSGHYFDGTRFDVLKIRIASSRLSDCKIYLTVFDDNVSKQSEPLSERYLKKDLVLNTVLTTVTIPFKELTTPEWWFQKNNITLSDVTPVDFSKVTALKIESGSTAKVGIIDTFTIAQVRFAKRPNMHTFYLLCILLVLIVGFMIFQSIPYKKNSPVIIPYDKKDMRSYGEMDAQRIAGYLAEHFSEPELSIITIGVSLGLSQKKIARIMKDEFKMSFNQYLASIRIHEAKRLLLETDRLVIDVAFGVGFNSISHFNRVFKASTLVSPLKFRNTKSTG